MIPSFSSILFCFFSFVGVYSYFFVNNFLKVMSKRHYSQSSKPYSDQLFIAKSSMLNVQNPLINADAKRAFVMRGILRSMEERRILYPFDNSVGVKFLGMLITKSILRSCSIVNACGSPSSLGQYTSSFLMLFSVRYLLV